MLRPNFRLIISLSGVALLLLQPTASRACDPSAILAFDMLGKCLSQRSSRNHLAPAWWQGEPEVLEAAATKRLEPAKEEEAEHQYLVARINELADAKEAAYSAYRTIHQTNEGCAYWGMATTRMHELEGVLFSDGSTAAWPPKGCVVLDFSCSSHHHEPLSTPEGKALEETYERACSTQRILERPIGSHHLLPTPADEAAKAAEEAAKTLDNQKDQKYFRMLDGPLGRGPITF